MMKRCLMIAVIAVAGLLIGAPAAVAAPSGSATIPTLRPTPDSRAGYAALGDSYSSGVGTRIYDPASGACQRSPLAYPRVSATIQRQQLTFLACSGAATADVRTSQIPSIPHDTRLVTITAGGDDVGFAPVLAACSVGAPTCETLIAGGVAAIQRVLPDRLDATLAEIKAQAPGAGLVVLGYPRLFGSGPCTAPGLPPSAAIRAKIDAGTDLLDEVIRERANAAHATFIDVRPRFDGHGTCATTSRRWINPPTAPTSESYHPNIAGHGLGYLPGILEAERAFSA
jgi:GDSL-like Lipase/Acylhydrolase family